jgi:hypothetical protein
MTTVQSFFLATMRLLKSDLMLLKVEIKVIMVVDEEREREREILKGKPVGLEKSFL